MIGIYKIVNILNGKFYVGQSREIEERFRKHKRGFKVERLAKLPLYVDMKKYGVDNFRLEVIEECKVDELDEKERYWLHELDAKTNGYNQSNEPQPMHDKDFAKKHGKHFTEWNNKMWAKDSYREMMSKKTRLRNQEYMKDPVNRAKAAKRLKKYTDEIKMPVGQYTKQGELIATFEGVREAERAMDLPNDSIGKVCRGVKYRKTANGFVWKYLQENSVETIESGESQLVE